VMGVVVSMIAIKALVESVRGATRALVALPDGIKALLILAALAALLHPGARRWICDLTADIGAALLPIWNVLWDLVVEMATLASESQAEANAALGEVIVAVKVYRPERRMRRRTRTARRGEAKTNAVTAASRA